MRVTWETAVEEAGRCGFSRAVLLPARVVTEYAPDETDRRVDTIDPWMLLPQARSVLIVATPFAWFAPWPEGTAEVSAYYFHSHAAYQRMLQLAERLRTLGALVSTEQRLPLKPLGRDAGFGVFGRNSLLHNDAWGSSFGMQMLVTDIDPQPAITPMPAKACGECGRCVRACPTGALKGNGRIDTGLCIRAHMMDGKVVNESLRTAMGQRLLGCEICQRACPQNAHIQGAPVDAAPFAIAQLLQGDPACLKAIEGLIGGNESRKQRIQAQAAIAAGNTHDAKYLPELEALTLHERPAVSEHARWAMKTIMEER